jgi:hypothetical protein
MSLRTTLLYFVAMSVTFTLVMALFFGLSPILVIGGALFGAVQAWQLHRRHRHRPLPK